MLTFERWAPGMAAAMALGVALVARSSPIVVAALAGIDPVQVLFGAVCAFGVFAAALMGLFAIVLSPRDAFFAERRGTAAFRSFGEYVTRGFSLSVAAMTGAGALIAARGWTPTHGAAEIALPAWWALSAWAAASVLRTYVVFLIWMRAPLPIAPAPQSAVAPSGWTPIVNLESGEPLEPFRQAG